jgi:hypothetical protein
MLNFPLKLYYIIVIIGITVYVIEHNRYIIVRNS